MQMVWLIKEDGWSIRKVHLRRLERRINIGELNMFKL